jgi:ferric-dicitrate binding protein FerR (iron transport regulator)
MRHGDLELTDDEREALSLVGSTPVPAASADARERARVAFLTGRRLGRPEAPAVAFGERERESPPRGPAVSPRRAIGGLALAAGVAGLIFLGGLPSESWRFVESEGSANARLDGEAARAGAPFRSGVVEAGPDERLDVELGETIRICLLPGSRARLPSGPGRWFGRTRALSLERGELFASSGDRELGFELAVRTREASVHLVGTTFAVRRNDLGTCICLYRGEVTVLSADGSDPIRLSPDRRVQVYSDGTAPTFHPIDAPARELLTELHAAGRALVRH